MTEVDFAAQIQRLKNTFGDKAYPNERSAQLWKHFKFTPKPLFEAGVDYVIMSNRFPPMLKEISEAVSRARESVWNNEKQIEQEPSTLTQLNTEGSKLIKKFLAGKGVDGMKLADELEKQIEYDCSFCESDGFITAVEKSSNVQISFRCHCPLAVNIRDSMLVWQDDYASAFTPIRKGL